MRHLRIALLVAALAAATMFAVPAAATPPFCGCWCQDVSPDTLCTDWTVRPYLITNCGKWLGRDILQCPTGTSAELVVEPASCATPEPAPRPEPVARPAG